MTGVSDASSIDNSDESYQSNDFEATYSSILRDESNAERSTTAGPEDNRLGAKPVTKGAPTPDLTQPATEESVPPAKGDDLPVLAFANISRLLRTQPSVNSSQAAAPATSPKSLALPATLHLDRAATTSKDVDSQNEAAMPSCIDPDSLSDYSGSLLSPLSVTTAPAADSPISKSSESSPVAVPARAMQLRVISPESTDPQFLSFGLTLKSTAPEPEKAGASSADTRTPAFSSSIGSAGTPATAVQTPTELRVATSDSGKGITELKRAPKPGASPKPSTESKPSSTTASAASANTNDEGTKESLASGAVKVDSGGDLSHERGHTGYSGKSSEVMPGFVGSEVKPAKSASPTAAALAAHPDEPAVGSSNPNQLVLRMQGDSGQNISVRVQDQGGQVQVAVRSSDPATASLLAQHLPLLQTNLQQAGWKSELFLPANPTLSADSLPVGSVSTAQSDAQNPNRQDGGPDWSGFDDARRKQPTIQQLWDEMLDRQTTTV